MLVTDQFRSRLVERFTAAGLDAERHLSFVFQVEPADFLALNRCADGFLDGFSWPGGVTTLEALHMGLVPITCRGPIMRSRHTARSSPASVSPTRSRGIERSFESWRCAWHGTRIGVMNCSDASRLACRACTVTIA